MGRGINTVEITAKAGEVMSQIQDYLKDIVSVQVRRDVAAGTFAAWTALAGMTGYAAGEIYDAWRASQELAKTMEQVTFGDKELILRDGGTLDCLVIDNQHSQGPKEVFLCIRDENGPVIEERANQGDDNRRLRPAYSARTNPDGSVTHTLSGTSEQLFGDDRTGLPVTETGPTRIGTALSCDDADGVCEESWTTQQQSLDENLQDPEISSERRERAERREKLEKEILTPEAFTEEDTDGAIPYQAFDEVEITPQTPVTVEPLPAGYRLYIRLSNGEVVYVDVDSQAYELVLAAFRDINSDGVSATLGGHPGAETPKRILDPRTGQVYVPHYGMGLTDEDLQPDPLKSNPEIRGLRWPGLKE